jgi:hypothetical protein
MVVKQHLMCWWTNKESVMKLSLAAVVVTFALLASASDVPLRVSDLLPAAEAKVSFEHDRNRNTTFSVHAKHLAQPASLTPPRNTYIVWVQGRGKDPQNAGVLRVNDSLEGSMSGTTPLQIFDVFVTAEDGPNVDKPSGPEVMRGAVQQH